MFSKLKKGIITTTLLASGTFIAQSASAKEMVALLLPENVNPRWEQQDAAAFVRTMAAIAPDVKVEVFNANNDTSVQQRQAERKLTQGQKSWLLSRLMKKLSIIAGLRRKKACH